MGLLVKAEIAKNRLTSILNSVITQADPEKMKKYYQSHVAAKAMFDTAVEAGLLNNKDTLLDASLAIAALWGAISI